MYAALSIPVAAVDSVVGALALLVFGAATVPVLSALVLGARRFGLGTPRARRVLAFAVLVAGLWSIVLRQGSSGGGHPPGAEVTHVSGTATGG